MISLEVEVRKLLLVFFVLTLSTMAFSQDFYYAEETEISSQIEIVKGEIVTDELKKVGQVTIQYMPAYDEARFIYSCPTPLFDQSIAMLAIKEAISSFIKDRGYYFYIYLKQDDTRYNNDKQTTYTSYVQLLH